MTGITRQAPQPILGTSASSSCFSAALLWGKGDRAGRGESSHAERTEPVQTLTSGLLHRGAVKSKRGYECGPLCTLEIATYNGFCHYCHSVLVVVTAVFLI